MKFNGKLELVYCNDKFIKNRIGYSLGTVYFVNIYKNTIILKNFGYFPKAEEFYYNFNVHLPKNVKEYLTSLPYNDKSRSLLEDLCIYNGEDIDLLKQKYENVQKEGIKQELEIETPKKKVLNFSKELKRKK